MKRVPSRTPTPRPGFRCVGGISLKPASECESAVTWAHCRLFASHWTAGTRARRNELAERKLAGAKKTELCTLRRAVRLPKCRMLRISGDTQQNQLKHTRINFTAKCHHKHTCSGCVLNLFESLCPLYFPCHSMSLQKHFLCMVKMNNYFVSPLMKSRFKESDWK